MIFKIATNAGVNKIEAEPIKISQLDCFIASHIGEIGGAEFFLVYEKLTGMKICHELSREDAIEKAAKLFAEHSEHAWRKQAQGNLKYYGIEYPVNA